MFLVGLSMGGCLVLRLAEEHGADISGLVLVNPSVRDRGQAAGRCCRCCRSWCRRSPGSATTSRSRAWTRARTTGCRCGPALAVQAVEADPRRSGQGDPAGAAVPQYCRSRGGSQFGPHGAGLDLVPRRDRDPARGQLSRRDPGQRRAADLRRHARPSSGGIELPMRDNGLTAAEYTSLGAHRPTARRPVLSALAEAGHRGVRRPAESTAEPEPKEPVDGAGRSRKIGRRRTPPMRAPTGPAEVCTSTREAADRARPVIGAETEDAEWESLVEQFNAPSRRPVHDAAGARPGRDGRPARRRRAVRAADRRTGRPGRRRRDGRGVPRPGGEGEAGRTEEAPTTRTTTTSRRSRPRAAAGLDQPGSPGSACSAVRCC